MFGLSHRDAQYLPSNKNLKWRFLKISDQNNENHFSAQYVTIYGTM